MQQKIEFGEELISRVVDKAITDNATIKHIDQNVSYLIEYKKSVETSFIVSIIAGFIAASGLTYALLKINVDLMFLSVALLAPALVALYRAYKEFKEISISMHHKAVYDGVRS